ncbi:MAG: NUDIX hydrolase [Chloroflexi bacterium]|nr:NUDIX hydrolase [Chloroflexota bacterium]
MRHFLARILRRFPRSLLLPEVLLRISRPRYAIGVVGVVMNRKREALLVEHVFHPRTPWGLPGGWSQHHETPKQSLIREMAEELQLTIEVGPLLLLERGQGNQLDFAYLCQPASEICRINGELLGWQWVAKEQLRSYLPMRDFHLRALQQAFEQAGLPPA